MRSLVVRAGIVVFLMTVFVGCSVTIPTIRAWRPWIRTAESTSKIPLGAQLQIVVAGETTPLLGDEALTRASIRNELVRLLGRRGFKVANAGSQYVVKLSYKTTRNDVLRATSFSSSSNYSQMWSGSSTGAGATYGLGIAIARAVGAISAASATRSVNTVTEEVGYTHTISIEMSDTAGQLSWKGEAAWESPELDILSRMTPSLQVVLSELPSDLRATPEVPEVRPTHALNFYKLRCQQSRFSCPALPYWISLWKSGEYFGESRMSECIKDSSALAAFVDLIQTAEYAVPQGNWGNWKNPLRLDLWSDAQLGGEYILVPSNRKVHVLIRLHAQADGYYAEQCWLADDAEWLEFQQKRDEWKTTLRDYYDYFVR